MPFNLLTQSWLPVRRFDGSLDHIRPAQIVEHMASNPVLAPDWPRPDLNIATLELLIGLLQVAFAPRDTKSWHKSLENPPGVAELDAAFAPLLPAFNLDGQEAKNEHNEQQGNKDAPRFMQDFEELRGEAGNIEALFIDSAGENTIKKNADLMVKRQRYQSLSLPAAAITLYALQQFAPSGGAGHRTSMRGGGPMSTFIKPPDGDVPSLWRFLWSNVLPRGGFEAFELPHMEQIFPWLAPTLTSENKKEVHEADSRVHPLQSFFGMPRRIALIIKDNKEQLPCDLTGVIGEQIATGYVTRPYGVNYGQWRHPLTPYYRKKAGDTEAFATHPSAGRTSYRNWLSLTAGNEEQTRNPARIVSVFRNDRQRRLGGGKAHLLVAGWAMSNMKPLDFILAEQPLHKAQDEAHGKKLGTLARRMVEAADSVSGSLLGAVQDALKAGRNKPKHDSSLITATRESFFADTEDDFHALLAELSDNPNMDLTTPARQWLKILQGAAFALFDKTVQPDPSDPQKARQIVEARKKLRNGLFGKKLRGLLHLPDPVKKKGQAA